MSATDVCHSDTMATSAGLYDMTSQWAPRKLKLPEPKTLSWHFSFVHLAKILPNFRDLQTGFIKHLWEQVCNFLIHCQDWQETNLDSSFDTLLYLSIRTKLHACELPRRRDLQTGKLFAIFPKQFLSKQCHVR